MNLLTLHQPRRLVIGHGCSTQTVGLLADLAVRRVLLVTSKSVRPQLQPIVDAIRHSGAEIIEAPFVPAEPTLNFFQAILPPIRAKGPDAVLGVGGGSALDIAKLLAALINSGQDVRTVFGTDLLASRTLPLICLPTTAGTGSEVSPIAVLLDEVEELKKGVVSPMLVPDAALVDPALAVNLPPHLTAATGLDALTHCLEAYVNRFAHPLTDTYALQGIQLIAANLLPAVQDGKNLAARSALALGSLYGGLCLGPVGTAAIHALSYPLGGRFRVGHGAANALLLPHVARFNLHSAPERYATVARSLGVPAGKSAIETAERGVELLARLARDCGAPQTLSSLNIPRAAIPGMAAAAVQVTRLLKNNVRSVSETEAAAIYEAAF